MDKYYIVWDDGKDFHALTEETDYYDAVIQANACHLAYHCPILVIHNKRIIYRCKNRCK